MSTNKEISDYELVSFLRKGDSNSFTKIYDRYFQLMFQFAYKKLKDEDLAKDFVQELFTQLWTKRETISEEGNIVQYLYISIRSRMFNYFAHQKVEAKHIASLKSYASNYMFEHTDHLIREKQLSQYIDMQIQALPSKMRRVFKMSRKHNKSHKEIANELGTTESNVSHHIINALKILRTKLGVF